MRCRNGHDLAAHGDLRRSKEVIRRVCCACLRIRQDRKNKRDRDKSATRRAAGYDVRCRNGHPRSFSTSRTSKQGQAYWTCHKCAEERMERRHAKKLAKKSR